MVIRKPYAFLIKHFKKIHIALLLFSLYIYYKVLRTNGFVTEFVSLGSYNPNIEPISKYVSFLLLIVILISFIGNLSLILLLKHKAKPWKLYLLPTIEYGILFLILLWTKNFFNYFDGTTTGMDIRLIRDVIFISTLGQFPIVIIYSMRILGVDLQKFNFKMDEEYLEMTKEDKEELEININIDYHVFVRLFNKTKRYLKYFYLEHKKICNLIAIIIAIILIKNLITFIFVTNKSYAQGDVYSANGYTFVIKNSYYTDKDRAGESIEKGMAFVVVDISITNNWGTRDLNLNNFHILNGVNNYTQTSTTYANEFRDIGKTVDSIQQIKQDETIDTILIYKVKKDKKVKTSKYVLYYQEINGGNSTYLRKIKLNISDISEIHDAREFTIGEKVTIKNNEIDDFITFEEAEMLEEFSYTFQKCKSENICHMETEKVGPDATKQYLIIPFSSKTFEGKELVDFSTNYGKIIYKNSIEQDIEIPFKSAVTNRYFGKYLYISVEKDFADYNKDIKIKYIIRDNQYIITIPIDIEGADE